MSGRQMEGGADDRRRTAREAREQGKLPGEVRATRGASKQRQRAQPTMTHQEKLDLEREGKLPSIRQHTPEARPGSRDAWSPDHERFPRLDEE